MASKVMVKLPVQPFNQVNKSKSSGQDLVTITRALPEQQTMKTEIAGPSKTNAAASDGSRVLQLEHNIRFLQDQHTLMLGGLHNEIDILRNKNRELQFQLIFAKGTLSTPSSPDDETKQKLFSISPKQINATSLQVEILEKELGELRLHVQEVDAKNAALTLLVEEQKCKLKQYEETINTYEHQSQVVVSPTTDQLQMLRKLDDADTIIRLLRRENSDLRRDVAVATSANVTYCSPPVGAAATAPTGEVAGTVNGGNDGGDNAYGNREYQGDGGGRSQHHQHHRGGRYQHYRSGGANYRNGGTNSGNNGQIGQQPSGEVAESNNWFPPLYQQPNYWANNTNRTSTAADLPSPPQNPPSPASSSLPSLQQQQQQQHNHRRSGHNNNHNQHYSDGHSGHYGGGGHRKYHNKGHHNRSGKGNSNGGDKSN